MYVDLSFRCYSEHETIQLVTVFARAICYKTLIREDREREKDVSRYMHSLFTLECDKQVFENNEYCRVYTTMGLRHRGTHTDDAINWLNEIS